jgi:hypothetical protein
LADYLNSGGPIKKRDYLAIQQTGGKNAPLSITSQRRHDGGQQGFIRVRGKEKFSRALCRHPSARAKNMPHNIASVSNRDKEVYKYCTDTAGQVLWYFGSNSNVKEKYSP